MDLAVSENYLRSPDLSDAAAHIWRGPGEDGGLVSELWVQGAFPSKSSRDSLRSLTAEGLFQSDLCNYLDHPEAFPADRPLFAHQAEAYRHATAGAKATQKPSLVITAGTGAGKTEAFLLPILSGLWAHPRTAGESGMRCLILYPMNALVTDQVTRLYELLEKQTNLSLFHFTSETPESDRDAKPEEQWRSCRPWSRESARAKIPDIVITNYSMLEYMLCRPQDRNFFGPALRYIVLDEAHLYAGTLAAEITLLLRRVRDRCGVTPEHLTHIATSATLGGTEEDLRGFAATVFSVPASLVRVIKGEKDTLPLSRVLESAPSPDPDDLERHSETEVTTLNKDGEFVERDAEAETRIRTLLCRLLPEDAVAEALASTNGILAPFLRKSLEQVPIIRHLAETLHGSNLLSLGQLTRRLWATASPSARKATILLLRLSAAAREDPKASPLVPHRLHFLVRAPQGLSICLNTECSGPNHLRAMPIGSIQTPGDRCSHCDSVTLPVHRCKACGQWALAGHENPDTGEIEGGHFAPVAKRRYYLVTESERQDLSPIFVNPETGEFLRRGSGTRLYLAPCPEHGKDCNDPSKCSEQKCPHCGTNWGAWIDDEDEYDLKIQPLRGAERIAVGVAAETVLHGMSEYPDKSRDWKPARGRRLLAFSDSRREAARLGPLLTTQHEIWVIRSAMVNTLVAGSPRSPGFLRRRIESLDAEASNPSLPQAERDEARRDADELRKELEDSHLGVPFGEFARSLARDPRVREVLDRSHGEKHTKWRQQSWEDNAKAVAAQAEALIAQELDSPLRTAVSTESAGLIEVVYPGLEKLPLPASLAASMNDEARSRLAPVWPLLQEALLDTIRADRGVDWSEENPGRMWNGESPLYGRWCTRSRNGWRARRFIGDETRPVDKWALRLWFARIVLRAAGCPESSPTPLLQVAFSQLFEAAEKNHLPWLRHKKVHETGPAENDLAFQIHLDKVRLRTPRNLYRCPDTGTLWPRSILGWAPLRGCLGRVEEISSNEADEDRRWRRARRELRGSSIFSLGLWGEEHSAQLSPEENKRRQFLFKEGARNLLSSTTTMELGIDIGGLNGVLLGNVPPGPANHMQRAGRAGRRSDGSSVVVTFARNRAFDRAVFDRFDDFLKRTFRRPAVDAFLNRPRFVRRHLHAMLLAEFFAPMRPGQTGAMGAYSNMGALAGVKAPSKWDKGSAKPAWEVSNSRASEEFTRFLELNCTSDSRFRRRCRNIVQQTPDSGIVDDDQKWREFIDNAGREFRSAYKLWEGDYNSLRDSWLEVPKVQPAEPERAKANAIRYQIKAISDITVIEWFSDACFLPRYGFPIHLQRLSVRVPKESYPDKSTPAEGYRLQRQSLLALGEYVPGAQVLVGGKLVESKGILKHWTEANLDEALGLNSWALKCSNDHEYLGTSPEDPCKECGEAPNGPGHALMFPRFGYTTAAWEPPKPPGRDMDRVGEVEISTAQGFALSEETRRDENFGGVSGLKARYYEAGQGQLLIRNAGGDAWSKGGHGFAVCTRCGFAMSEERPANPHGTVPPLPERFKNHASVFSSNGKSRCWPKNAEPVLRHKVLAAKETTDVLILDLPRSCDAATNYSLSRALVLSGARLLELDGRELAVKEPGTEDAQSILLYDTVPGGAGHCLELIELGREWLLDAQKILRGSESHNQKCRRACLECILDFGGQFRAERLERVKARDLLDAMLS